MRARHRKSAPNDDDGDGVIILRASIYIHQKYVLCLQGVPIIFTLPSAEYFCVTSYKYTEYYRYSIKVNRYLYTKRQPWNSIIIIIITGIICPRLAVSDLSLVSPGINYLLLIGGEKLKIHLIHIFNTRMKM